jgi:hypothetical protein
MGLPAISDSKVKTFWERPEGTTGKIFLFGFLGGLGYALYKFLPVIITLLQNTIYAGILVAVLAGLLYVALDSRTHALIAYAYKSLMRGITKMFVNIDPIAIIENYIDDMKKNRAAMEKQLENLNGQMRSLKNVIDKNDQTRQSSLKLAQAAKSKGVEQVMALNARKAGRLQNSNITLQALYTKMEMLYRVLGKMYENSQYIIDDVVDEVDVKKRERNALLAGHSAFKSALRVVNGDPDKKYMFDQAMETMVDDIGMKLGEMERFMEVSANFMQSVDLQNGVYQEEGLKQLEEWTQSGPSLLLGNDKTILIDQANNSREVLDLDAPLPVAERKPSKYANLLDDRK